MIDLVPPAPWASLSRVGSRFLLALAITLAALASPKRARAEPTAIDKATAQTLFDDAIRGVFQALAALVAHHVLLVRKIGLVQFVRQIAHAVGFEPQGQFELVRRKRFEIIGAVEIGRAINVACARGFQQMEVRAAGNVFRSFEHHVFE